MIDDSDLEPNFVPTDISDEELEKAKDDQTNSDYLKLQKQLQLYAIQNASEDTLTAEPTSTVDAILAATKKPYIWASQYIFDPKILSLGDPNTESDYEDFSIFNKMLQNGSFDHVKPSLINHYRWCRNEWDVIDTDNYIQEMQSIESTIDASPHPILARLLGGMLDPINFLFPVGLAAGAAAAYFKANSKTILASYLAGLSTEGALASARDDIESKLSWDTYLLSGVMSAFMGYSISNKIIPKLSTVVSSFQRKISSNWTQEAALLDIPTNSPPSIHSIYDKNDKVDLKLLDYDFFKSPIAQALTSDSPVLNKFANNLFRHNFATRGTKEGISRFAPAQEKILEADQKVITFKHKINDELERYVSDSKKNGFKVSEESFHLQVCEVLEKYDADIIHENPHISAAARHLRYHLNEIFHAAEDSGLTKISKDNIVKKRNAYVPHIFDKQTISERPVEFHDFLKEKVIELNPRLVSEKEVSLAAKMIYDKIMTSDVFNATYILDDIPLSQSGFLKFRELTNLRIHTSRGFLISDIRKIYEAYSKSLVPKIEFKYAIKRCGVKDFEDLINFHNQHKELTSIELTPGKQSEKYAKKAKEELKLFSDLKDLYFGEYLLPSSSVGIKIKRTLHSMRTLHCMAYLGYVPLSVIGDEALQWHKYGVVKSILGHLQSVASIFLPENLKSPFMRDYKAIKNFGFALEEANMNLLLGWGEKSSYSYGVQNKFEKGLQYLSAGFNKASLLPYINSHNKHLAALFSHYELSDLIMSKVKLSKKSSQLLAEYNLSKTEQDAIKSQILEFSSFDKKEGLRELKLQNWTDPVAKQAMMRVGLNAAMNVVLSPSGAELPRLFSHPTIGPIFGLYQRFTFGIWNSYIMPMLSQDKIGAAPVAFLCSLIGFNALEHLIRTTISTNELPDVTSEEFFSRFINRIPLPFIEVPSSTWSLLNSQKNGGIIPTLGSIFDGMPIPKMISSITQPIGSNIKNLFNGKDLKLTDYQMSQLIHLIPFNNIILIDQLLKNTGIRPYKYERKKKQKTHGLGISDLI